MGPLEVQRSRMSEAVAAALDAPAGSFAQQVLAGMGDPVPAATETDGLAFLVELLRQSQD